MTFTAIDLVGVITLFISVVGFIVAIHHAKFYLGSSKKLSRRLKWVFFSDAMIYAITGVFGFWAVFQGDLTNAIIYQVLRIPILLFNIFAGIKLYLTYQTLYEELS